MKYYCSCLCPQPSLPFKCAFFHWGSQCDGASWVLLTGLSWLPSRLTCGSLQFHQTPSPHPSIVDVFNYRISSLGWLSLIIVNHSFYLARFLRISIKLCSKCSVRLNNYSKWLAFSCVVPYYCLFDFLVIFCMACWLALFCSSFSTCTCPPLSAFFNI